MSGERKLVARTLCEIAQEIETENCARRPCIAITSLGGEHGEKNIIEGVLMAAERGVNVCCIGSTGAPGVHHIQAENEDECHKIMERMLNNGDVDGAVTMHYSFPVGVATVGRVITPARGKQMFIAGTTGISGTERTEAMIKNALYGIIAAKACGIREPRVGLLNLDGARQAEHALKELGQGGYAIYFGKSARSDGGAVMRGNDLLMGTPDVMVTDSLTGNAVMKLLAAFTSGGSYEATGYGYGPGIGPGMDRLVLIISRASGAPVIANALEYAVQLVKGRVTEIAEREFADAERAGLGRILARRKDTGGNTGREDKAVAPPVVPVTETIAGIDVMDIEDAVGELWRNGIYAEPGMGCTGPIVMVNGEDIQKAAALLKQKGYLD